MILVSHLPHQMVSAQCRWTGKAPRVFTPGPALDPTSLLCSGPPLGLHDGGASAAAARVVLYIPPFNRPCRRGRPQFGELGPQHEPGGGVAARPARGGANREIMDGQLSRGTSGSGRLSHSRRGLLSLLGTDPLEVTWTTKSLGQVQCLLTWCERTACITPLYLSVSLPLPAFCHVTLRCCSSTGSRT